ncbi:MAG: SLC13 family permease [Gammaproteobacteria bacterium]|nr:SLC13 family permease [Gammaproteobacteria bacterium]
MSAPSTYAPHSRWGLFIGPLAALVLLLLPTPSALGVDGQRVAALALLMAIWWMSEALPLAATSLLPLVLLPLLGVRTTAEAAAPYAHHLIFLFLGGFMIAAAVQRWGLHRRLAVHTVRLVGLSPRRMVLGFMVASATVSMWVTNTATTLMLLPVGLAVIAQIRSLDPDPDEATRFATCLLLGIAYGASIGGVGTLIGTAPNAVIAGVVEELYGQSISFFSWMLYGVPLAGVMLVICWLLLTRLIYPVGRATLVGGDVFLQQELAKLGPMSREEKWVLAVFSLVAACWIFRGLVPLPVLVGVKDGTFAIMGAILLFVIPVDLAKGRFLLDWETALKIPWEVLILFGGGLSLAAGFGSSGLADWIAGQLGAVGGLNLFLVVALIALVTVFLTEMTSNTATSTILAPVMGSLALAIAVHPYVLIVAAGTAASYAFMLPVGTPPNAIVFSSGEVTMGQMVRAGLVLNLVATLLVTLAVTVWLPLVWGFDPASFPLWAG